MKINKIEKKLENRRKLISLILTLFIHFTLLLISSFWKFEKKKEENIVITVKLVDKEEKNLEISPKPNTKKESITEKQLKKEEIKDITKQDQYYEKEILGKNEAVYLKNQKTFEDYEKEKIEEKRKLEEKFFSETNKEKSTSEYELEKILQNLDRKDNPEKEFFSLKKDEKESKKISDGMSSLIWIDGRSRALIYKTDINIPEEFKKEGLFTSLILKLTVSENGLITEVNIEKSSGFSILDYDIANQVKKWKFEKALFKNRAILSLSISY